jgi:hypothetical protein
MSAAVVLDATPLGTLCHPRNPPPVMACRQWIDDLLAKNRRVIVPEIADYASKEQTVQVLVKVCRAMHFAHQRSILHRDLKPANILLSFSREGSGSDPSAAAHRLQIGTLA